MIPQLPLDDHFDPSEFFARYAVSIPRERKLELVMQFLDRAKAEGASTFMETIYYLDSVELELFVTMLGLRFPVQPNELEGALLAFLLSQGRSTERVTEAEWVEEHSR